MDLRDESVDDLPQDLPVIQTSDRTTEAFPGGPSPAQVAVGAPDVEAPEAAVMRLLGDANGYRPRELHWLPQRDHSDAVPAAAPAVPGPRTVGHEGAVLVRD